MEEVTGVLCCSPHSFAVAIESRPFSAKTVLVSPGAQAQTISIILVHFFPCTQRFLVSLHVWPLSPLKFPKPGVPWWCRRLRIWHCHCHGPVSLPGPGNFYMLWMWPKIKINKEKKRKRPKSIHFLLLHSSPHLQDTVLCGPDPFPRSYILSFCPTIEME